MKWCLIYNKEIISNSSRKDIFAFSNKKEFCVWEKKKWNNPNQTESWAAQLLPSIYIRTCGKNPLIHSETAQKVWQEHVRVLKLYDSFLSGCE